MTNTLQGQGIHKTADLVSIGSIVRYTDHRNQETLHVVIGIDREDYENPPFIVRQIDNGSGFPYANTTLNGWEFVSA